MEKKYNNMSMLLSFSSSSMNSWKYIEILTNCLLLSLFEKSKWIYQEDNVSTDKSQGLKSYSYRYV